MSVNRRVLANAIRFLTIDAVQKANSGHPGMPLGMADIAQVLWGDFLQHNPNNPNWINRDRFILSNGHGCMLLYSLLHLTGYDLSIDEIKKFRQLNSKTPGHPEYGLTPGVEITTGPLGQGIASAVGMALAEKLLATKYNKDEFNIIDHFTYCFLGDGCLMEGISHESCSLAGTLGLNKLIVFWDDNNISIDGHVDSWFNEDVPARFKSYHWNVIDNIDGHNPDQIKKAIIQAKNSNKPTLICCKTTIGFGAPNLNNSEKCHGSPLGIDEIKATRNNLNWEYPEFVIPDHIYKSWDNKQQGQKLEDNWNYLFAEYKKEYPKLGTEIENLFNNISDKKNTQVNKKLDSAIINFINENNKNLNNISTRQASQNCLDLFGEQIQELFGGSADLTSSNLTFHKYSRSINKDDFTGNYLHYGVREFAMSAIMNGVSAHGGFIPYGGTFLTFSDYSRNAIRLSALMQLKVIYVFSHDSIGLGEDGPTHQAIEHLSALRLIPDLSLWRPADSIETIVAWQTAIQHNSPTCLALTRQKVQAYTRTSQQIENIKKGAYIMYEPDCSAESNIDLIIIATGSELHIAIEAAKLAKEKNINVRVISMPCVDLFLKQSKQYKQQLLPDNITARIAIEAGITNFWYQFVGLQGVVIGIDSFGHSAPGDDLYKFFKIEAVNVAKIIINMVNKHKQIVKI